MLANACSDLGRLSDEQRRLLVACGAGAGMAAAYGVPLGGALFALEVLRGVLALRLDSACSSDSGHRDRDHLAARHAERADICHSGPIPALSRSQSGRAWSGPAFGVVSVFYVRSIAWADRARPKGWRRCAVPVLIVGLLGVVSIRFPQLLGNGKDIADLAFMGTHGSRPAPGSALSETACHRILPRQRHAGRPLHPFAGDGGLAGRGLGTCLDMDGSGQAHRAPLPSSGPRRSWRRRRRDPFRPSC